MRVLIVDDDVEFRTTLSRTLERSGAEVTSAVNGEEALRCYASDADVVVTDLQMPGMDGLETIAELRRMAPAVKIIAISGGRDGGPELAAARRLGAQRILTKPFWRDDFLEALHELDTEGDAAREVRKRIGRS